MAIEKLRLARKRHWCDQCDTYIEPGEYYLDGKGKEPRFDKYDNQIGIEYVGWKLHVYSCREDMTNMDLTK